MIPAELAELDQLDLEESEQATEPGRVTQISNPGKESEVCTPLGSFTKLPVQGAK